MDKEGLTVTQNYYLS